MFPLAPTSQWDTDGDRGVQRETEKDHKALLSILLFQVPSSKLQIPSSRFQVPSFKFQVASSKFQASTSCAPAGVCMLIPTYRQTIIQTYRPTDQQAYRPTDIQTYRPTDMHYFARTLFDMSWIIQKLMVIRMLWLIIIFIFKLILILRLCKRKLKFVLN